MSKRPSRKKKAVPPASPERRRTMLELTIPSETRYLQMVRELARRFAESAGFGAADAQKIGLAVDEATTNVIQHAYHGRDEGEIEIHFEPEDDNLTIQLLHDGDSFDPAVLPEFDPERFITERRKGGMGVYIMKQVMDRVDYGKAGSGKNMWLMVRSRKSKGGED